MSSRNCLQLKEEQNPLTAESKTVPTLQAPSSQDGKSYAMTLTVIILEPACTIPGLAGQSRAACPMRLSVIDWATTGMLMRLCGSSQPTTKLLVQESSLYPQAVHDPQSHMTWEW